MKVNSIKSLMALAAVALATASCENGDWEFPDYDHTAVYFASQSPIRTITLGEDVYDTSLDNEHKCQIMATMGGVYKNTTDRIIDIKVDNSLRRQEVQGQRTAHRGYASLTLHAEQRQNCHPKR